MIEPRDTMFEMHVAQSESVVAALDAMKKPRVPVNLPSIERFAVADQRRKRMSRMINKISSKSAWFRDCAEHRLTQLSELVCDLAEDCYADDFERRYPGVL